MLRVLPFVLVLALAACSSDAPVAGSTDGPAATAPDASAPPAAATPMPPGAALSGPSAAAARPVPAELPAVVARVNGHEISRMDFEKAVRSLEGRAGGPVPASERDRIYRQVLDELIAYRLLLQETQARKIDVPDSDVAARFDSVRGQFPSAEAFAGMLEQQELTADQARSEMKNELGIAKLLETEIAPKVSVGEQEITSFYKENPAEFQVPQQVRASHILIAAPSDAGPSARQAARETAAGLLARARAGEDFAALAKEFSQDPGTAVRGGDLGFFNEGAMVPAFNDVAFSLAPGTISDIVETEYGMHIIKVAEKQAPRAVSLEEVRPSIAEYLEAVSRQQHTQAFVRTLREKGQVDVYI